VSGPVKTGPFFFLLRTKIDVCCACAAQYRDPLEDFMLRGKYLFLFLLISKKANYAALFLLHNCCSIKSPSLPDLAGSRDNELGRNLGGLRLSFKTGL
jgi:hypothetical protein